MKIWRPLARIFSKKSRARDKEALTGQIVRSVSGRDEGTYYVITGHEDGIFVTVADGVRRKIGSPKRKNVRHLLLTGQKLPDEYLYKGRLNLTDEELSRFLSGVMPADQVSYISNNKEE